MGRQIVKKDNGKFAVWSTIVDDWLVDDATEKELKEWYEEDIAESARRHIEERKKDVNDIIQNLKDGRKPYGQFSSTYEELGQLRLLNHKEYRNPPWRKCSCKGREMDCEKCDGLGEIPPWEEEQPIKKKDNQNVKKDN